MTHAPSVLCLGEALIDMVEQEVDGDTAYRPYPGGSSMNVAVGVSRLGVRAEFAGALAQDALGDRIAAFLGAEAVGIASSPRVSAATPLALATLVNSEPQYSFYASPPAYAMIAPADLDAAALADAAVVHAGSFALGEDGSFETARHAFVSATGLTTLDPNIRASMTPDVASLRARIDALLEYTDVLKLSTEDAAFLWPEEEPAQIAARALAGRTSAVILTRAADGVTVYLDGSEISLPVPSGRPVINTTAAGDTIMATTASLLAVNGLPADPEQWGHMAQTALAAAAITCSRPGGAASMPTIAELAVYLGEIAAAE